MWTDDPVRDAERYSQEKETREDRIRRGGGFSVLDYYGLDDDWGCDDEPVYLDF